MARGEAAVLWMLLVMELRDQIVAIIMVRNRGYVWQKKMRMKKRVWIMVVVMVVMIMMIIMVNMTIERVMMIIVMMME